MAGNVVIDQLQIGNNGTPANNFVISTLNNGSIKIQRGNIGGSLTDVVEIDADGTFKPSGFEVARTYQTPTRALNTTYTNNTDTDIEIFVQTSQAAGSVSEAMVDGATIMRFGAPTLNGECPMSFTVKPGSTYRVNTVAGTVTLVRWTELRKP